MAIGVTPQDLLTRVRRLAHLRGNEALTVADWIDELNQSIEEVWDRGTSQEMAGFGHARTTIPTVIDQDTYALPSDFLKHRMLKRATSIGGTTLAPVRRVNEDNFERENWDEDQVYSLPGIWFFSGSSIVIKPVPRAVSDLHLLYVRTPPVMTTADLTTPLPEPITTSGWSLTITHLTAGRVLLGSNPKKAAAYLAEGKRLEKELIRPARRDRGEDRVSDYSGDAHGNGRGPGYGGY